MTPVQQCRAAEFGGLGDMIAERDAVLRWLGSVGAVDGVPFQITDLETAGQLVGLSMKPQREWHGTQFAALLAIMSGGELVLRGVEGNGAKGYRATVVLGVTGNGHGAVERATFSVREVAA